MEDEADSFAADVPADPKARELKAIFDQAVGKGFAWAAYSEHFRLARKLVRTLLSGWLESHHRHAADDLAKEWNPLAERLFGRMEKRLQRE